MANIHMADIRIQIMIHGSDVQMWQVFCAAWGITSGMVFAKQWGFAPTWQVVHLQI